MIRIGIDYYPERWDRGLWEEDAGRMEALSVHVERLEEFARRAVRWWSPAAAG